MTRSEIFRNNIKKQNEKMEQDEKEVLECRKNYHRGGGNISKRSASWKQTSKTLEESEKNIEKELGE